MTTTRITDHDVLTVELPGLTAVRIAAEDRVIAIDGNSGATDGPTGQNWTVRDLRGGTYGDFHRLLPAGQCHDAACAASGQHASPAQTRTSPEMPALQYILAALDRVRGLRAQCEAEAALAALPRTARFLTGPVDDELQLLEHMLGEERDRAAAGQPDRDS
jgi:hypothetical protein